MTKHTRMTTHRSGPKRKRQDLSFLSRLIWCCRKRNNPRFKGEGNAYGGGGASWGKLKRTFWLSPEIFPTGKVSV